MNRTLLLILFSLLAAAGCRKQSFEYAPDISLRFSTDTLLFDTVFSNVGSTTSRIVVYNPSTTDLLIPEIYLSGRKLTGKSDFRLNINGVPTNSLKEVEIPAGDSIYVFVEVTVDPNNAQKPLMVRDSLVVDRGNGRFQQVQLEAVGRNAIFYRSQVLPCNTVWTSDKPIIIYNSVLVDSLCELKIEAGTEIYFNRNSSLFVLGSLQVQGREGVPVTFRGDRIDPFYRDLPGTWQGIHFLRGSTHNLIDWADIRNGLVGVRVDSLPADGSSRNLLIRNTNIQNMSLVGLLGYSASIEGENLLVANCGKYCFVGDLGGRYVFRHATFANSGGGFSNPEAAFAVTNANNRTLANNLYAELLNCIVWGSRDEQLALESSGNGTFTINFKNSIFRTRLTNLNINGNRINVNPLFQNPGDGNYQLDSLSRAAGIGEDLRAIYPGVTRDLSGFPRKIIPAAGCYEYRFP